VRRLNPLRNTKAMLRLNPYAAVLKRNAILTVQKRIKQRAEELAKKRKVKVELTPEEARAAKVEVRRKAAIKKTTKPKKAVKKPKKTAEQKAALRAKPTLKKPVRAKTAPAKKAPAKK